MNLTHRERLESLAIDAVTRIAAAREQVAAIEPLYKAALAELESAEADLRRLTAPVPSKEGQ